MCGRTCAASLAQRHGGTSRSHLANILSTSETHRRYVRTSIAVLTFVPDGWVQGQAPDGVVCGSIFQGAETPKMTPKTTPSGTPQNPPGPPKNKTYLESGPMKPAKIYIV